MPRPQNGLFLIWRSKAGLTSTCPTPAVIGGGLFLLIPPLAEARLVRTRERALELRLIRGPPGPYTPHISTQAFSCLVTVVISNCFYVFDSCCVTPLDFCGDENGLNK